MKLQDYDDPRSLGMRLRARRLKPFLDMVDAVHRRTGACRVLDVGGRRNYWAVAPDGFLQARNCTVVLSNLELAHEDQPVDATFTHAVEDACALDRPDGAFDLVHSNSVIEHVGGWGRMQAFAREVRRVATGYFVQTPDYWFPLEPHFGFPFFAQMPRPLQRGLVMRRNMGFIPRAATRAEAEAALDGTRLLDGGQMRELFPDGELTHERVLGLSKSLIAIRRPPV